MPQFIQFFVIFTLNLAIFSWRNNCFHSGFFGFLNNRIRIIAAISQKDLRIDTINQLFSLLTIRGGTFCNKDSDRHTMRIHGQMYLGVKPPFVFAMS